MTHTELISAPASWTQCVFQRFFFISLRNFNQLDATSKVMYQHEIICTGNEAYLINNYLFRDNAVAASLWKIRELGELGLTSNVENPLGLSYITILVRWPY